jgi:hypothetical protein
MVLLRLCRLRRDSNPNRRVQRWEVHLPQVYPLRRQCLRVGRVPRRPQRPPVVHVKPGTRERDSERKKMIFTEKRERELHLWPWLRCWWLGCRRAQDCLWSFCPDHGVLRLLKSPSSGSSSSSSFSSSSPSFFFIFLFVHGFQVSQWLFFLRHQFYTRIYHWRARGASTDYTFSWEPVLFRFLCHFPACS